MRSRSVSPDLQDDDEVDPSSPVPQEDIEVDLLAESLERMHIATNYIGYHRIFRGPFIFQPSITSNHAFDSIIRPQIHPHPIFRLPPELLCEVFLHYLHEIAEKIGNDSSFPGTWIRVTHVCRYWREVGLACPQLWTYLRLLKSPGSMQLIDLFLARSKQALLSINMFNYPQNEWTPAADFITRAIFKEAPRIASIQLSMPTKLLSELLSTYLAAPKLWLLAIKAYDEPQLIMQSFNSHRVLPSLKTLAIGLFLFKWSTQFIRPTLTRLILSGIAGAPPPQLKDMLDVLRSTPLLQAISLIGSDIVPKLPVGITVISPIEQPVTLHHLRSITFTEVPTCDAICLFNHLLTRPDIDARFRNYTGGDDDVWLIHHSINLKRSKYALQFLDIRDVDGVYRVIGYVQNINLRKPIPPCTYGRNVTVSKQTASDAGHLVRGLQLSEVRTLRLKMPKFPSSSWHTVFGSMKKLQSLYLYGMVTQHVLVALGREIRPHDSAAQISGSSQEKPLYLFPAINEVVLDTGRRKLSGAIQRLLLDRLRAIAAERDRQSGYNPDNVEMS